jgi:hypothetical protein
LVDQRRAFLPLLLLGLLVPRFGLCQEVNPRAFARSSEEEAESLPVDGPLYLFLNGPIDPETLRERLDDPDFVILSGSRYERLRREGRGDAPGSAPSPLAHVVESVLVTGRTGSDPAALVVRFGVDLRVGGPSWVPLRLDGLVLRRVREDERECPVRASADKGWEVELSGSGTHRVEAEVLVPQRREAEGLTLDVPIPPAAETRLDLAFPAAIESVRIGSAPAMSLEREETSDTSRLRASVTPRERLRLSWEPPGDRGESGPPVLSAQGEIVVEVDAGTVRARSVWSVRSERGPARLIEVQIGDPQTELLGIELDDRVIPLTGHHDPNRGLVSIPLNEPLGPGQVRRLTLTTRRALEPHQPARWKLGGFPIVGAASQSGTLSVVQGPDLWVSGTPGRGLRAIDPRKELPDTLRTRPSTVLAYQFVEQPFDLELRVDPAPPVLRVEQRTALRLRADSARVVSELDYRVNRGNVPEVRVALGEGLELDSAGPDTVVSSSQTLRGEGATRVLVIRLTSRAAAEGAFRLQLNGRQPLQVPGTASVGLFRPQGVQLTRDTLAVLSTPEMAAEPPDGGFPDLFRVLPFTPPSDWSWPLGRVPAGERTLMWLSVGEGARSIPLSVCSHTRNLSQATKVLAELTRRRLDLRQRTTLQVRDGILTELDITVPEALEGSWEVEGDEITSRYRVGPTPEGGSRYRLRLAREVVDQLELRFRSTLTLDPGLPDDQPATIPIPWIGVVDGERTGLRIDLAADASIDVSAAGEDRWSPAEPDTRDPSLESPLPNRLHWTSRAADDRFPAIIARGSRPAVMPDVLVSRSLIRAAEAPDRSLMTTCWLRIDRHPGSIDLRLGPASQMVQARLSGEAIRPLQLDDPREVRFLLPREQILPLMLRLDIRLAVRDPAAGLLPFEVIGGGVVEESLWEISLPWSRALVGVPPGWSDLNRWYWDRYVWKRRPRLGSEALAQWVGLSPQRERPLETPQEAHAYLFSRIGPPAALQAGTYSRAVLVGICSGTTLALGLILLLARPPARLLWLCALAAAAVVGASVEPDTLLLVLQSSTLGLVLIVVAALTQRFVDRRRSRHGLERASSLVERAALVPTASNRNELSDPGLEGSTVVRRRASTTIDYAPVPEPSPGEGAV